MQDFLLELGFEELPARFINRALAQLSEAVTTRLAQSRLSHGKVHQYSTPRRLALLIEGLQTEQTDLVEEVKGPPLNIAVDQEGNLTKAGQGFLRSQGVEADAVIVKDFQGADYMYIKKEVPGQATKELLKPLVEDVLTHLHFPKNMRWGDYELRYARPLRWIVAIFGDEVIPVKVGPVQAGSTTYGHRQLSSGAVALSSPGEYVRTLREHYVVADAEERRSAIWRQVQDLAGREGVQVLEDGSLLDEVVNLVEYPTAFCGQFAAEYLEMPSEVLITSMKEHQRYFPVYDPEGNLAAKFVGVRNGESNHLDNVVQGNEKVLAARLSDAKFFYDEDLKTRLENNLTKLEGVVFQDRLGTMGDKVRRIQELTGKLADQLGYVDRKETIVRTALLCKCDLVSQMVYEFPELQGIMGEKYALAQGEDPLVAAGIREHYLPRFAGDTLPAAPEGIVVSIADKLDTLVGYFAVGMIPTGSQDPFALRRQAQGIVQILLQGGCDLSLSHLIETAEAGYGDLTLDAEKKQALLDFFLARLRVLLTDQGYAYDLIDAAMASRDDRLVSLLEKVKALTEVRTKPSFADLMTGFERVANLAAKAESHTLNPEVFTSEDSAFHEALAGLEEKCEACLAERDWLGILHALGEFRVHVDRFFDDVMIMDPDPAVRSNRLSLLSNALGLYSLCGDLRLIVVNK